MFSFFETIFAKVTSAIASIIIAIGLVSPPAPVQPVISTQPQMIEDQKETDTGAASVVAEIETLRKEIAELKKQKAVSPIQSIPLPPKVIEKPKPKTYTLPNGAIIDEDGNILNQAELDQKQLLEALERQRDFLEKSNKISTDEIVRQARKATTLVCSTNAEKIGCGSGFVFEADGYILTNAHVVEGVQSVKAFLDDGRSFEGTILGRNENIDLAILRISASGLPILALGNSDESSLPVTSDVIALGYPLVLTYLRIGADVVVTAEEGDITARRAKDGIEYLQTNANINKGNSGGPLINSKTEVVGVNTWILIGADSGFAIPINLVKSYIPQLKAGMQVVNTPIAPPPQSADTTPPVIGTVTYVFTNDQLTVGFRANEELKKSTITLYSPADWFLAQLEPQYSTTQGVTFQNVSFVTGINYKIRIHAEDKAGNSKFVDILTTNAASQTIEVNK